jgi:hypothetical protein
VLGPILFLVFINDLSLHVKSKAMLFTDDCVVYREIATEEDCHVLQDDFKKLALWEKRWGMSFHPEKCINRVHRKRNFIIYPYILKGHTLEIDSTTTFLGVPMSVNLSLTRL